LVNDTVRLTVDCSFLLFTV